MNSKIKMDQPPVTAEKEKTANEEKSWAEKFIPWKDWLGQVSFVASIGAGFTLSACVSLACSSSFQGSTDTTALASLARTSAVFSWGASSFAISLIASAMGLLLTQHPGAVILLQNGYDHNAQKIGGFMYWCVLIAFPLLAVTGMGFIVAGTVLTAIGLNNITEGSGTMLEWSLLVIGLPVVVLALCLAPKAKELQIKK